VRKIEREGDVVTVEIVFRTTDEAEAFEEEIRRIAAHRAAGVELTNLTDGGEGCSGYRFTPEQSARLSASLAGKTFSDAHKQAISRAAIESPKFHQPKSESHRQAIADGQRGGAGRVHSPAWIKAMARRRGKTLSPEHRKAISDGLRRRQDEQ